jgi:cytidylate kinase
MWSAFWAEGTSLFPTLKEKDGAMSIVSISMQIGSYGEEIAALIAKRCNFQFVDQAQVHQLAQECDAEFSKACTFYEAEMKPSFFESFFFNNAAYTALFESLNFELASRGNVVIVGRGAQIVLRNIPGVFKARIVAPRELRIKRVMDQKKVSMEEAATYVEKYDHQRQSLIRSIFNKDLRDLRLYDLIINTVAYTPEGAADILCLAIEKHQKDQAPDALKEDLKAKAFAKRVESYVKKKIWTSSYRNIEVTCTGTGEVTLSGFVPDKKTKEHAEEIAATVSGVKKVTNELRTTELSF